MSNFYFPLMKSRGNSWLESCLKSIFQNFLVIVKFYYRYLHLSKKDILNEAVTLK